MATMENVTLKVDRETAEAEFDKFVDAFDLQLDPKLMSEEVLQLSEEAKERFIKAVQKGSLIVEDDGTPVFMPVRSRNKDSLKFHEPEGSALKEMDKAKKDHNNAKMFNLMSNLTKVPASRYAAMAKSDLNVCLAITLLLMD